MTNYQNEELSIWKDLPYPNFLALNISKFSGLNINNLL